MKECSEINCHYPVFSKGKCRFHMEKKPLRKSQLVYKRKAPSSNDEMREFFLSIWRKRPHYSEISGQSLGNEPLSTYFHHIIEKSDRLYGELGKFDAENIVLLTAEEHEIIHKGMYRYEKINQRRKYLLTKYENLIHGKTI